MKKIKNKKLVITGLLLILISLMIVIFWLLSKSSKTITFTSTDMNLKYDNTWKIAHQKDNNLLLTHSTNSQISFIIKDIPTEYRELELINLLDKVYPEIQNQNQSYQEISRGETKIGKNNYPVYQILYENKDNQRQTLLYVGKYNEKIFIIYFDSSIQYFDILLDSVDYIVYNFKINDLKPNYKITTRELKTGTLKYNNHENKLVCDYSDLKEYQIKDNNYLSKYKIPLCFPEDAISKTYSGYYSNITSDYSVRISTSNILSDIYEYVHGDGEALLRINIDYYYEQMQKEHQKNPSLYKNLSRSDQKITVADKDFYIYKFIYENSYYQERVYIVYAIDYRRTFVTEINASSTGINKELIMSLLNVEPQKYL